MKSKYVIQSLTVLLILAGGCRSNEVVNPPLQETSTPVPLITTDKTEIDAYKKQIEQAYKQQLDYVASLKDEQAKQSAQTPYSAAVQKETELEMQNEKDLIFIREAFREFSKENHLSE